MGARARINNAAMADSARSSFALFAALFAMGKKLFTDKTLRLHKSEKKH